VSLQVALLTFKLIDGLVGFGQVVGQFAGDTLKVLDFAGQLAEDRGGLDCGGVGELLRVATRHLAHVGYFGAVVRKEVLVEQEGWGAVEALLEVWFVGFALPNAL
jgi:hypothetical protein